jgi:hypothetical protein
MMKSSVAWIRETSMIRVLILFLFAGFSFSQEKRELKEFSPKDAGFKVKLPGEPTLKESVVQGMKMRFWLHEEKGEKGGAYTIAIMTLSDETVANDKRDPEKRLNETADGMMRNIGATVTPSEKIKIANKYDGLELTGELPNKKGSIKARVFFVGKNLYQLTSIGKDDWTTNEETKQVLESFQLIEK